MSHDQTGHMTRNSGTREREGERERHPGTRACVQRVRVGFKCTCALQARLPCYECVAVCHGANGACNASLQSPCRGKVAVLSAGFVQEGGSSVNELCGAIVLGQKGDQHPMVCSLFSARGLVRVACRASAAMRVQGVSVLACTVRRVQGSRPKRVCAAYSASGGLLGW